jgi:hypothetical protein
LAGSDRGVGSGGDGGPAGFGSEAYFEAGESGDVHGGGEQVEVGADSGSAAHPGPARAVAAPHQVRDLPFDLGSGGPVVGLPRRVGLPGSGPAASTLEPKLVASGQVAPASVGAWEAELWADDSGGDADSAGK